MTKRRTRLAENVPGEFYVDSSCIDCDACRQIAGAVFRDHGDQSSVYHQPGTEDEYRSALMALVACPTASIRTESRQNARVGSDAFPTRVAENVYFCGFTSESSFGAWSYLIVRPDELGGNILVDSPRFTRPLIKRIEEMGGIRTMLLTHRDDVADHDKFAKRFGCERVMHGADGASRLGIERIVEGERDVALGDDLLIIPTPGHTRGHMVFLYQKKFLFSGDHLWWSPERRTLSASSSVAWFSWSDQIKSLEKLLAYEFEWVLPGHGRIHHDGAELMREHLRRLVSRAQAA